MLIQTYTVHTLCPEAYAGPKTLNPDEMYLNPQLTHTYTHSFIIKALSCCPKTVVKMSPVSSDASIIHKQL